MQGVRFESWSDIKLIPAKLVVMPIACQRGIGLIPRRSSIILAVRFFRAQYRQGGLQIEVPLPV